MTVSCESLSGSGGTPPLSFHFEKILSRQKAEFRWKLTCLHSLITKWVDNSFFCRMKGFQKKAHVCLGEGYFVVMFCLYVPFTLLDGEHFLPSNQPRLAQSLENVKDSSRHST